MLVLSSAQAQQSTCQRIGAMAFCDNGLSSQTIGNLTFYNNGFTREDIGNQSFYSSNGPGSPYPDMGNTNAQNGGQNGGKCAGYPPLCR